MAKPIRVLIVDDHPVVLQGIHALIDAEPDMEVVGEGSDGQQAVDLARALEPDVVLLDLVMPGTDGVAAICQIKQDNPEARILVLTGFDSDDRVFPAIEAGALGYLLKDSSPLELRQAVREVHEGKAALHPNIALKLIKKMNRPSDLKPTTDPLTPRESEVLTFVAQGLTNHEIADQLWISENTVGVHVSNILAKLHLANRTQAALWAVQRGLAEPPPEIGPDA
jgi:NarL family two-component system response regulator LiaR